MIRLFTLNHPVYLLGDLNAKHPCIGTRNTNITGTGINMLINRFNIQHIGPDFPTFIKPNTATAPDIVLANNKIAHNHHITPGPITVSDHIPMILTITISPIQIPIKCRFAFQRANWERYKEILGETDIISLNGASLEDIDQAIEKLEKTVMDAAKKCIPKIAHRVLPHAKMDEDVKRMLAQARAIHERIKTNGATPELKDLLDYIQEYLQRRYRVLKGLSWQKQMEKLQKRKNPSEYWQQVRKLQGLAATDKTPYLVDQNGHKHHSDSEKEEVLRRHWQKIFTISQEENEEFDEEHEDSILDELQEQVHLLSPHHTADYTRLANYGHARPITVQEIKEALTLTKNKAPGISKIKKPMLVNAHENVLNNLKEIYNASLSAGYFPEAFKKAEMIFLPKPGKDKRQLANQRPISLLEIHGKLYERIINYRLVKELEERNVLSERQHGFRRKHGTQSAIATVYQYIAKARGERKHVNLVLRDVSKAFDKVWWNGLKAKILRLQLDPIFLRSLCDFLSDRSSQIREGNHQGPLFFPECAVPQGSCLSPTLYNLYTADMPGPGPNAEYVTYADDVTQIITSPGKSEEILARRTAREIKNINDFEKKWKIKTNGKKFQIIPIDKGKRKLSDVLVDGDIYRYSYEGKLLGWNITTTGGASHVKIQRAKAITSLNRLQRFQELPQKLKKTLYKAFVGSVLTYPAIPLHTLRKTPTQQLQSIQNKGIRWITNTRYTDNYTAYGLHEKLNMTPINIQLHNRACKTWNTLVNIGNTTTQTNTVRQNTQHYRYPLSYEKTLADPPTPQYIIPTRHQIENNAR